MVDPSDYLTPFLQVIKSPETSGTVTDVALMAVLKILKSDMLGTFFLLVSAQERDLYTTLYTPILNLSPPIPPW